MTRIVTSHFRYKHPPRKGKAMAKPARARPSAISRPTSWRSISGIDSASESRTEAVSNRHDPAQAQG
jgi:hypothetical protein